MNQASSVKPDSRYHRLQLTPSLPNPSQIVLAKNGTFDKEKMENNNVRHV